MDMDMYQIRIVVVDDHPLFRQGVMDTLSLESDLSVIADASSGEDGYRLITELLPDIAIIDVNLPGINGHKITRQLSEDKIGTRVLLLTAYDDTEQKVHAMRSGAAAYCTKDIRPETLVKIIRTIAAGSYVVGDQVMNRSQLNDYIASNFDVRVRPNDGNREQFQALSLREMEVLSCITQGMSNKEIAQRLNISQQTVKNHVTSILKKLDVDDRTQAAIYALRLGWVQLHQPKTS
jgi:DNA-binding NarL/FixJ family response regulator